MKKINKILSVLLAMVMLFSLCACGKEADPEPTPEPEQKEEQEEQDEPKEEGNAVFNQVLQEGYTYLANVYSLDMQILFLEYVNADHTDFVRLEISMADEYKQTLMAYLGDKDQDEQWSKLLEDYEVKRTSLKDQVPDQSEFDVFTGKTIQSLVDAGYTQVGSGIDEDNIYYFLYRNDVYTLKVITDPEFHTYNDWKDLDLNAQTIKIAKFYNIRYWSGQNI